MAWHTFFLKSPLDWSTNSQALCTRLCGAARLIGQIPVCIPWIPVIPANFSRASRSLFLKFCRIRFLSISSLTWIRRERDCCGEVWSFCSFSESVTNLIGLDELDGLEELEEELDALELCGCPACSDMPFYFGVKTEQQLKRFLLRNRGRNWRYLNNTQPFIAKCEK